MMGKLVIDGNSVFEIDEECMEKREISPDCDVEKYFEEQELKIIKQKKRQ